MQEPLHIILHWKDDRWEHTKRLHLENYWTLSSLAGLYDKFALRLSEWEKGGRVPDSRAWNSHILAHA